MAVLNDGGGPAFVGDGGFPGDVFGFAPGGGEVGGGGVSVSGGSAECGPVAGGGGEGKQ